MVLVEEDVHKVHLVRIPAQPQGLVEGIPEMEVKNHLAHKGRVEQEEKDKGKDCPQSVPRFLPEGQEGSRYADKN